MIGLTLPSYPNPYAPSTPFAGAFARISALMLDVANGTGRATLNVHPSPADVTGRPLGFIALGLGDVYQHADPYAETPVPEIRFPTLAELMADPDFAAAYATIAAKLHDALIAYHPGCAGAAVLTIP